MKDDYSDTVFSSGLAVWNTNNNRFAIVIDGHQGLKYDRSSLVMELCQEGTILVHTPPNRALRPTGKIYNLEKLRDILNNNLGV